MEKLKFHEVIEKLDFGKIAILIDGSIGEPYSGVGTAIYFDEYDNGALKFLGSGRDVVVCKAKGVKEGSNWIIVDR